MWITVLSGFWGYSKSVIFLVVAGLVFLNARLLVKAARRIWPTLPLAKRVINNLPLRCRKLHEKISIRARRWKQWTHRKVSLFLLRWVYERITTVDFFSAAWIVVVWVFFTHVFPQQSLEAAAGPPTKPLWLDCLGYNIGVYPCARVDHKWRRPKHSSKQYEQSILTRKGTHFFESAVYTTALNAKETYALTWLAPYTDHIFRSTATLNNALALMESAAIGSERRKRPSKSWHIDPASGTQTP